MDLTKPKIKDATLVFWGIILGIILVYLSIVAFMGNLVPILKSSTVVGIIIAMASVTLFIEQLVSKQGLNIKNTWQIITLSAIVLSLLIAVAIFTGFVIPAGAQWLIALIYLIDGLLVFRALFT